MKKNSAFLLILTLLFGFLTTVQAVENELGYISVNESMTKEISPNQAEISIGIKTSDKSLQNASEKNKAIANKVYSSIKALLGMEDSIKTDNYTASPQYVYTKENERIFDKYIVSNTVMIKTKKLELVSKFIDEAIANGATDIDNLYFSVASGDYNEICNDALAELTKRAYGKANLMLKSINSQITGIKLINATCNTENSPRPFYGMMMNSAVKSDALSSPIEKGTSKIYANIDASFYVK